MQDRSEWLANLRKKESPDGYRFTHGRYYPRYHFEDSAEYTCEESISISCTQLAEDKKQWRLVRGWAKSLPHLHQLKELYFLSRFPNSLLEPVSQVPNLQHLHIKWSGLKGIEPLKQLQSLKALHLGSSPSIVDPEVVASLHSLKKLSFENIRKLYDLEWLAQMPQLEELHVDGSMWSTQKVLSLEPLKVLSNLTRFSMVGASLKEKDSVMVLSEMPNLKTVWLGWNWSKGVLKALVDSRPDLWVNGQRGAEWQEVEDRIMDLS